MALENSASALLEVKEGKWNDIRMTLNTNGWSEELGKALSEVECKHDKGLFVSVPAGEAVQALIKRKYIHYLDENAE